MEASYCSDVLIDKTGVAGVKEKEAIFSQAKDFIPTGSVLSETKMHCLLIKVGIS